MPPTVHTAMADNRPEKQTMRGLWVQEVASASSPTKKEPLYLTLAGAEGRDIRALVDAKLIRLTENGAIRDEDAHKVVAIESNEEAFLALKRAIEGLDVRKSRIEHMLRSDSSTKWPEGNEWEIFRAKVVNFDFDGSLLVEVRDGQLVFPQLSWVRKVAEIHAQPPQGNWCLCLTFQAQIQWQPEVEAAVMKLLADNFQNTEGFSEGAEKLLGSDAFTAINECNSDFVLSDLPRKTQQCILMALIPKKMFQLVRGQGWSVETRCNVQYGGSGSRAPMVSFVFGFRWDQSASTEPEVTYRKALLNSVEEPAQINPQGAIGPLS